MSANSTTPDSQTPQESHPTEPTKSSTKEKILAWVQPHKAPHKPEEVPPKLQEAIDQMNERKAQKLEEMEKNGQKPNTRTSQAYAFQGGGGVFGGLSGLSG